MNVAIIPARGGSKRIPRKNVRPFLGKPMLAYSIEAAQASGLFESVLVSTDDAEIADVARRYGAEVPFMRPAELADDYTGTDAITAHAVAWLAEHGRPCRYACCIYATAPFLRGEDLRRGYEKVVTSGKAFVFAATTYAFPIQRAIRLNTRGEVEAFQPEHIFSRSQDLEPAWHDAGQFYWGTAQAYLDEVTTFSTASMIVELPRYRVRDIDTEEDWEEAELLYRLLQDREHRHAGGLP
jgi:pseudaminic acid cytidylyltransferase